MTSQSKCVAAIYDCSYYIYMRSEFDDFIIPDRKEEIESRDNIKRQYLESELRRIFTSTYFTPGFSGNRDYSIVAPIMSDFEFKSIEREIYEFTLYLCEDTLNIINFREETEPDDSQPDPDRPNKKPRDRYWSLSERNTI